MLIEQLLTPILSFLHFIFNLLPNVPSIPTSIVNTVNSFFDLIFNNAGVLGVFVSLDIIKVLIPLLIIVINFEEIYDIISWVIKKIPMINIE